jgi:hypothetical protein
MGQSKCRHAFRFGIRGNFEIALAHFSPEGLHANIFPR